MGGYSAMPMSAWSLEEVHMHDVYCACPPQKKNLKVLHLKKYGGAGCGGQVVTEDQAATRIQACVRGMLGRTRARAAAHDELVFLHMRPRVGSLHPGCWLNEHAW